MISTDGGRISSGAVGWSSVCLYGQPVTCNSSLLKFKKSDFWKIVENTSRVRTGNYYFEAPNLLVKFLALCLYFGCYDLITTGVPTYTIIGCWLCRYVLTVSFEVECLVSQDTKTVFMKFLSSVYLSWNIQFGLLFKFGVNATKLE